MQRLNSSSLVVLRASRQLKILAVAEVAEYAFSGLLPFVSSRYTVVESVVILV